MAKGIVEQVNEAGGQFCVRCQDGTYRYFRCAPNDLPRPGDAISCPDERPPDRKFCLVDLTENERRVQVFSSIHHLPRDVALRLIDGDDVVSP